MRKKITLSIQDEQLKQLDERAQELELTRSSYLWALVLRDIKKENGFKRRIEDYVERQAKNKPE